MKQKLEQKIEIPEGIVCEFANQILKCKKDSAELERKIDVPEVTISINGNEVIISCEKGNKNHYKRIMSQKAHIKNLFKGLQEKFTYQLEVVHLHFPITVKHEGNEIIIANFFGEKVPRRAKVLPNVDVEIQGTKITIASHDKEAAGQTAANLEKATKVKGKDKRIYQDGIYITEKPGAKNA